MAEPNETQVPRIEEKFKRDKLKFERIANADLVCRDCMFAYDDTKVLGNTSRCGKFQFKPNAVLSGGKCDEYNKA